MTEAIKAVIIDTETANLKGEPIEIAYGYTDVIIEGDKHTISFNKEEIFNERFSCDQIIGYGAMATHHITPSDLEGKPHFSTFELPKDIKYFIGHNISYDTNTIALTNNDVSQIKEICTLALARYTWPELDAYSLGALYYFINKDKNKAREELKNAHSAKADICFTANLLHCIVKIHKVKTMEELYELSEVARVPRVMPFGKHKDVPISDLEPGYVTWALNTLDDMDPYLRKALLAF